MSSLPEVGVRRATTDDMRFVSASWFESYWKATARDLGVPFGAYKPGQDALIRRLTAAGDVLVAYLISVPDEILGYSVIENETLHYVYVKSVYRRQGIATGLIQHRAARYSHKTRGAKWIAASLGLTYDPYTLTSERT